MIQTQDPTTWITANGVIGGVQVVQYENTDGLRWRMTGTCNACGLCENPPEKVPSVVIQTNRKIGVGEEGFWERTLVWHKEPGEPGAVEELEFQNRKDIPMTPHINKIEGCCLKGEYL